MPLENFRRFCHVATLETKGQFYCSREPLHEGPCAARPAIPDDQSIGQYDDGSWYWLDETWNYGDDVRYALREEAASAQLRYCVEVLG